MLAYLLDLRRTVALVFRLNPVITIPIASDRKSVAVECELGALTAQEKAAAVGEHNARELCDTVAQLTE